MIELRTTCGWKALVHKPLLCHYSSYYEAALYGKFKEATSDHLELELNRDCADWFVRWLYSGQLKEALYAPDADELFNIYIFADRVDILALRRTVMAELVSREMSDLPYSSIILATKSLLSSAPLYRYAVEWYTNHWIPSEAERNHQDQAYEDLPKEFLHLVMSGLALRSHHLYMDKRFGKSNTEMLCKCCGPFCHYHEHDSYDEWWQSEFVYFVPSKASY
jgi:hypothetical protein